MEKHEQIWHHKSSFHDTIREYHDKDCRQPMNDMDGARTTLHHLVNEVLKPELKKYGYCDDLVFCGSSYQGLKVDDGLLEWDIDLLIRADDVDVIPDSSGGYNVKLEPTCQQPCANLVKNGEISGQHWRRKLQSSFAKMQHKILELHQSKVRFRHMRTAVQMDVYTSDGSLWFQVDLVPTLELEFKCVDNRIE